ncbi:SAM-dependent methyltransferase [Motilibacter aurantiacus]|uniref:SAM-dependent methyltransferase n=1 Tax=Motilibacter aurantiacus TaxID=2714955 RepID=UPI0014091A98|nr:SAM-dependent methyltransferase [Motilibacter aurantiacus]
MPQALETALSTVRAALLDPVGLRRAVASGRRRGAEPQWRRVELRPVELKAGRRLQVVRYDERQAFTANADWGADAAAAVDELLAEPFGNWHVETADRTVQLRVTKKGEAQVHTTRAAAPASPAQGNDRAVPHLLDPGDPLFTALKAGAAKRRQVDAFLRAFSTVEPDLPEQVRVVDLGCGNAYLTFAAYRWLSDRRSVQLVGVDSKAQSREHGTQVAAELGWGEQVRFVEGTIAEAPVDGADVVLALHACDTATDEALARAVRWGAKAILVAPCCHHDVQRQLREHAPPEPYALLTRHGILRERFGDVLTDAVRAALLRLLGYRVDVVEFVDAEQTPRNVLLRAVRTGTPAPPGRVEEYLALVGEWRLEPALARMLAPELAAAFGGRS